MTPLVETVARAISWKIDAHGDTERIEQQRVSLEWPRYREHAQAAIAAVFDADPRITALQAENEKLRELLGECDWLLKWANEHLMAFSNMRLETEFFSRREHAIERIQAALEPKP